MNVSEFFDQFDPTSPQPVYLFSPHKGPRAKAATFEPKLAERAINQVVDALVDPSMKDMCFGSYHADESDPGEIASVAETLPFLTDRRVVVVLNAERYESASAAAPILNYLERPADTTVLLFVAAKVDKRSKFYKACVKVGEIVECGALPIKGPEIRLWVTERANELGKGIEPRAVQQLLERTGNTLGDLDNALNVVAAYIGERDTIKDEDVTAACADVAEEEIWALTDAIASSNTGKAVQVLRDIIGLGKSEFEIMGSINWLLKSAYTVALGSAAPRPLNDFAARKVRPLADKLGMEKLPAAFALCLDTDVMLRSTGVDRALAMELLVIKLAAPMRRRRTA